MSLQDAGPAANFDGIARVYRWAEYLSLGPLLERTRETFLPELATRRSALVLGDGDGRFAAALLDANRSVEVWALDTSAKMLGQLQLACRTHASRLRVEQRSALTVNALDGTDLIVTHFLLDCFTQAEVDALVARLAQKTVPGTLWLLSDFAVPKRGWVRPLGWLYVRALYAAFRLLTGLQVQRLPDPQTALRACGFQCIARRERLLGVLYTELWVAK